MMEHIFTEANGVQVNGALQSARLVWDVIMISMCLYELIVNRRNGIILAFLIFACGDIINATYSVIDAIAIIYPVFRFLVAITSPAFDAWIIATGTGVSVVGRYLIPFYLWVDKKQPTSRRKVNKNDPHLKTP